MGSFGRDRLPPGHDFDFTTDAPTTSNHTVDRTERFGIRAAVAGRGGGRVFKTNVLLDRFKHLFKCREWQFKKSVVWYLRSAKKRHAIKFSTPPAKSLPSRGSRVPPSAQSPNGLE